MPPWSRASPSLLPKPKPVPPCTKPPPQSYFGPLPVVCPRLVFFIGLSHCPGRVTKAPWPPWPKPWCSRAFLRCWAGGQPVFDDSATHRRRPTVSSGWRRGFLSPKPWGKPTAICEKRTCQTGHLLRLYLRGNAHTPPGGPTRRLCAPSRNGAGPVF